MLTTTPGGAQVGLGAWPGRSGNSLQAEAHSVRVARRWAGGRSVNGRRHSARHRAWPSERSLLEPWAHVHGRGRAGPVRRCRCCRTSHSGTRGTGAVMGVRASRCVVREVNVFASVRSALPLGGAALFGFLPCVNRDRNRPPATSCLSRTYLSRCGGRRSGGA